MPEDKQQRLPAIALEDLFAGAAYQSPRLEDDPAARILGLIVEHGEDDGRLAR